MDRMKTFLTYALLIVVFFVVSLLLENGLLIAMYSSISGEFDGTYIEGTNSKFEFDEISAKACNVNGYLSFNLINSTGSLVKKCYIKVELYNEQNLLADTEYIEVQNINSGDSKSIKIKFKANNIESYQVSIAQEAPDTSNIISILGWEIDLTNVFGFDLSETTIFGMKIADVFNVNNIKNTSGNAYNWIVKFLSGVPLWGYGLAFLVILISL